MSTLESEHSQPFIVKNYIQSNIETQKWQTKKFNEVKRGLLMKCEQLKQEIALDKVVEIDNIIDEKRAIVYRQQRGFSNGLENT